MLRDARGVAAAHGPGERVGEAERLDVVGDAPQQGAEHLRGASRAERLRATSSSAPTAASAAAPFATSPAAAW